MTGDRLVTQSANLAVKSIPRRARFIAEIKLSVATGQLSDHSFDRRRRAIDLAQISNFTLAAQIGYRQCVARQAYREFSEFAGFAAAMLLRDDVPADREPETRPFSGRLGRV